MKRFILTLFLSLIFGFVSYAQSYLGYVNKTVNFRTEANTSCKVISSLQQGTALFVISKNKINGFYQVLDIETNKEGTIEWGNAFNLSIKLKRNKPLNYPIELYLEFKDKEQRPIAGLRKEVAYNSSTQANLNIQISIDEIQFSKGIYSIDLVFKNCESNSPVYRINNFANFQVTQKDQMWVPFNLKSKLLVND